MINENKIREACASNRELGFKMLMDSFQVPIYNYIRRLVISHEDAPLLPSLKSKPLPKSNSEARYRPLPVE